VPAAREKGHTTNTMKGEKKSGIISGPLKRAKEAGTSTKIGSDNREKTKPDVTSIGKTPKTKTNKKTNDLGTGGTPSDAMRNKNQAGKRRRGKLTHWENGAITKGGVHRDNPNAGFSNTE